MAWATPSPYRTGAAGGGAEGLDGRDVHVEGLRGRYGGGDGDFTASVAEHGRWGGRGAVLHMPSLGVAGEVPMGVRALMDLLRAARGRCGGGYGDFTAGVAEHGRWGERGAVL